MAVEQTGLDQAARLAWRATEPLHGLIYFAPEAHERYAALGIPEPMGYFASRSAALGPVGPGPVAAAFYNFNPALIARALPAAWSRTTPAAAAAARLAAADAALTRGLGGAVHGPEVAKAAQLARRAAEAAAAHAGGRALYAAHAELPWPDAPHTVLWHAQMLLREFRGDGHVAALLVAGISGLEALVLHAASGEVEERFLRISRGWSRDEWAGAVAVLRDRGLLDPEGEPGAAPALSEQGRALRAGVEASTDRLAAPAYAGLGEAGCARLAELTRPLSRTIVTAGMLNPENVLARSR
ncbi:SCO6745 family protein [Krasilnikovia sp. MM14-A1004]|uniref:SCO6745 family protein n=1 Tax=Krasilnikovia sp. MM14-A1004 TaxID=3373541 RepID=UPI00399C82AB